VSCQSNVKHVCTGIQVQSLRRGYPYLITNSVVGINADEVAALREGVSKADDMIRTTCVENGVEFVDTRPTFDGHGCDSAPNEEWINCLVNPVGDGDRDQSFHPKEAGNDEYARLVLAQI
jgi:hypothetical protein